MKTLLSHPTGNAFVRAAALGLANADILGSFQTTIATFSGGLLDYASTLGPFKELNRRRFDPRLKTFTQTFPWVEAGRLLTSKAGLNHFTRHETGLFCVDSVYKSFDRHVATEIRQAKKGGATAVYAYEDGALISFQEAKKNHMQCLYDLPIGYWRAARRLLEMERILKPEWASTINAFKDSEAKLARKDEELRLADRIYVASQFTASTLADFPGDLAPIEVIPYGFPPALSRREYSAMSRKKPLNILFVGGLSQRKGIAELFTAVNALGANVKLTVVGRKVNKDCPILDKELKKHHWIPSLPHPAILKLMQENDVLVFPSLFEGFGLVITEAMSQGTPVITTERTAGPDLIEHGHNGWIVEAGSASALQIAIEALLSRPELIPKAGRAALEAARLRPWEMYGQELANSILRHL